jgi:hypothetical protein
MLQRNKILFFQSSFFSYLSIIILTGKIIIRFCACNNCIFIRLFHSQHLNIFCNKNLVWINFLLFKSILNNPLKSRHVIFNEPEMEKD